MSEKADFEPSLKRASHFVKIIVACPHRLPKLPESTLRKQARPNNGSLFYSHCGLSRICFEMTCQATNHNAFGRRRDFVLQINNTKVHCTGFSYLLHKKTK
jgi:hypothetical protein